MAALESPTLDPSRTERARDDWRSTLVEGLAAEAHPPAELARELAEVWAAAAHEARASVAVHARFALQLLRLGAPAALLSACARLMQDEVAHAQACFSLARRFAGPDLAEEPLAPEPPLEEDLAELLLSVIARGCIGGTVAALSAREALEHCQDPATREVLMLRQSTKAQEALFAWRFIAWSLRQAGAELHDRARVAFLSALGQSPALEPPGERERARLRYGVLSEAHAASLEQRVLRSAVLPCMDTLLARPAHARA